MSKGDAPSAPDPYQSAAAQYEYGTAGANYNMGLNAVNTQTPYGSTSWSENPSGVATTGYPSMSASSTGIHPAGNGVSGASGGAQAPPSSAAATPTAPGTATGSLYSQAGAATPGAPSSPTALAAAASAAQGTGVPNLTPPQYTENTSLSAPQQTLLNLQEGNTAGQGELAGQVLNNNAGTIAGPLSLQTSVPGSGDQASEYGGAFNTALQGNLAAVSPTLNAQYESLDSSLRNSGNLPGSPAYQTAMSQFTANEGGVLDQASGAAENTGINLENTLYGQNLSSAEFGNQAQIEQQQAPLQNYEALESGVAPAGTSAPAQPTASTGTPDIMSAFNNQYQGQLNSYNSQVGSQNAEMGDIGTIAAMALMFSDRRLKKDLERVGATPGGLPLYRFRYLWDLASVPRRLGVLAQDLLRLRPAAVFIDRSGYLMVDYAQVN